MIRPLHSCSSTRSTHNPLDFGGGDFESLTINLASAFLATDSDGDSVVLDGQFNIRIENDVPVQNFSATVSGSVQEDALTDANSNHHSVGNAEGSGQTTVAEGELSSLVTVGADENGPFSLLSAPGGLAALTSKGGAVLYSVDGDTLTGYVNVGGAGYQAGTDWAVFTLQVDSGGHYKFTLLDQIRPPSQFASRRRCPDSDSRIFLPRSSSPISTAISLRCRVDLTFRSRTMFRS